MLITIPEKHIIRLKDITHIQNESNFIVIYTTQDKNYTSEEAFNTVINISYIGNSINLGHKRSLNIFGITYINVSRRRMQILKDVYIRGILGK